MGLIIAFYCGYFIASTVIYIIEKKKNAENIKEWLWEHPQNFIERGIAFNKEGANFYKFLKGLSIFLLINCILASGMPNIFTSMLIGSASYLISAYCWKIAIKFGLTECKELEEAKKSLKSIVELVNDSEIKEQLTQCVELLSKLVENDLPILIKRKKQLQINYRRSQKLIVAQKATGIIADEEVLIAEAEENLAKMKVALVRTELKIKSILSFLDLIYPQICNMTRSNNKLSDQSGKLIQKFLDEMALTQKSQDEIEHLEQNPKEEKRDATEKMTALNLKIEGIKQL